VLLHLRLTTIDEVFRTDIHLWHILQVLVQL